MKKILILGGYGVFGGRLAELLSDIANIELLICGRSQARAEAFCAGYYGAANVRPFRLDRSDIEPALRSETPDLVVDASGPFQDYGANRYQVIEACIASGVNYLDFADAADFVFGVTQFDGSAKAAGVFAMSGVSSFPVLTAAVLRDIGKTMEIRQVEGGIAPSPCAGIGLNVIRAVVGYAGEPVKLVRGGKKTAGVGLAESMRFTIAVPGKLPLNNIHFSLVDVPDLQVIPPEYPEMTDIWMGAGPVPEVLHRILNLLAKARFALHLPSMVPLSGLFFRVLNMMKFGEHRGGMFVQARGLRDGQPVTRSWHLLAEGDDGPYIPSMAIEAVIRKTLAGDPLEIGARPATNALELKDYDALFARRTISTGFRNDDPASPIYKRVLGSAYELLPAALQDLHGSAAARRWSGRARVQRGKGILAKCIAVLFGFPKEAEAIPISVTFTPEGGGERWTRDFGGSRFSSLQTAGTGKDRHLIVERFGPLEFSLALVAKEKRLYLVTRRWTMLGIPMPKFLMPGGTTFESVDNGRFCFNVEIAMPAVGLIVAYQGILNADPS